MAFDREKVLRTAQAYVQKKRYDKAIPEYQKIVQHDPTDVRTLLRIGDLQSRMEAYADAIATYERVAKQYAEQGFALKAVAVYKQIRELIAKHVPFLADRYSHIPTKLAELFTQLGLVSDALAAYDEIAIRLQKAGRDRDAIEVFRKILSIDPANPLHHLRLAEALSRVRDVDGAIQQFSMAAEILVKLGRNDDALKVLERLLHHRAEARFARQAAEMYLARAHGNDGMLALAKLQVCFQANPKDLETLGLLAKAFIVIGQPAKAVEVEKEMARLAHEQGKLDVLERIARKLQLKVSAASVAQSVPAPTSAQRAPAPVAPPPKPSRYEAAPSARDHEADFIELDDDLLADEPELIVDDETTKSAPAEQELSQATSAAVVDASRFRSQGQPARAVETLRAALQRQPHSVALHSALCEVLLEMGNHGEAVQEMLTLAELALDDLDADGAIGYLLSILQFEPEHPRALELLAELGYDLPKSQRVPEPRQPERGREPLPAYELEDDLDADVIDIEPEEIAAQGVEIDVEAEPGAPLEAGPISEPGLAPSVAASSAFSGGDSLEEALEEADFFASRGLLEDAWSVVQEQLERAPDHPLLLDKLHEIEAALAARDMGGSGPRELPQGSSDEDRSSDFAVELDLLDVIPEPRPEAAGPDEQVDVEEVFAKFKEGVRAQIDESDSATHYDLGVAYQEMGLFADAIEELEIAARDPKRECVSHSMVGAIHRSQGDNEAAVRSFARALEAAQKTVEQELGILYELGDTCEAMRNVTDAIAWFERLADRTPSYEDPRGGVQDRLDALTATLPNRSRARAVNDLDDLDAAFDAIVKAE